MMDPLIIDHLLAVKGWTPKQMARELGVGTTTVYDWLRGRCPLGKFHELAFRQAVGAEDYYIAAQRVARGTEPTKRKYRGFL